MVREGCITSLIFIASIAWAEVGAPVTDTEVSRLEAIKVKRPLFDEERLDLASLYFLRGECGKVKDVYGDGREPLVPMDERDSDMLCACDGRCDMLKLTANSRPQQKLAAFRQLLAAGQTLADPQVASLWAQLQERPEARYALYLSLRPSKKSEDRMRAGALWKELATLNVAAP